MKILYSLSGIVFLFVWLKFLGFRVYNEFRMGVEKLRVSECEEREFLGSYFFSFGNFNFLNGYYS